MKTFFLLLPAAALAAWAANDAAVRGPVTGFVFDSQTHALRPMLGIPGAAYLGPSAVSPADAAWVSPDGSAALVAQAGRLSLYTGFGNATPAAIRIPGGIVPDRVAWAPADGAAALYSSGNAQVQIVTSLVTAPVAASPIDVSGIPGQITAMAFDGQLLLLGVSGSSGGIYSVKSQSAPERIASAYQPSALALAGADLYFADQKSGQIWQVRNYGTQPASVSFSNDAGISSPVGLQLSADGARLFVANSGSRTVGVYDVASRSGIETLQLDFTPSGMDRFGDASVFLLNSAARASEPLYVLSDSAVRRAVYFVPVPAASPNHIRYHPVAKP